MNHDELKIRAMEIRAIIAKALEESGSGWAQNQVTLFLDSVSNSGYEIRCVNTNESTKTSHNNVYTKLLYDLRDYFRLKPPYRYYCEADLIKRINECLAEFKA